MCTLTSLDDSNDDVSLQADSVSTVKDESDQSLCSGDPPASSSGYSSSLSMCELTAPVELMEAVHHTNITLKPLFLQYQRPTKN